MTQASPLPGPGKKEEVVVDSRRKAVRNQWRAHGSQRPVDDSWKCLRGKEQEAIQRSLAGLRGDMERSPGRAES